MMRLVKSFLNSLLLINKSTVMKFMPKAVLFILAITLTFHCAKEQKEIKIGAILPMTGPSALLGELARNGLSLAEEEINDKGGINGSRLRIVFEDGMADPNSSISAFRKLISVDKLKFIITTHSSVGLALSPLADKEKVILLIHASHPQITGKSSYVFRHSNIAEQESQIIVDFVNNQNHRKYAIAVMNDDYGIEFREKLKQLFSEFNISLTNDVVYEKTETDFKTISQKLLSNKNPDIVVIAGLGNGVGLLIRRLKEFGYKGDILITLGAIITGAFGSAGESAKGTYYVDFAFDASDKNYHRVSKQYSAKYQSNMQSASILFYNTLLLLTQAIEKAGYDALGVSEYLKSLSQFIGVGEEMKIVNYYDIVPSLQLLRQ